MASALQFPARQLAATMPIFVGVSALVFRMARINPGDPAGIEAARPASLMTVFVGLPGVALHCGPAISEPGTAIQPQPAATCVSCPGIAHIPR